MREQVLCAFPDAVRASHLLGADVAGFLINAYLALQHQWPDRAGFEHYRHLLTQRPEARAEVLRAIAASPNAAALGVRFIDDLPPDHRWDAQQDAGGAALGNQLRLARVVADVAVMGRSAGQLATQPLQAAVQTIVDAQLASLSLLESRLAALAQQVDALAATPPRRAGRRAARRPADWRGLRERQMRLEADVAALRAQLAGSAGPLGVGAAAASGGANPAWASGAAPRAWVDEVLTYLGAVPLGDAGGKDGA